MRFPRRFPPPATEDGPFSLRGVRAVTEELSEETFFSLSFFGQEKTMDGGSDFSLAAAQVSVWMTSRSTDCSWR